jgi:hypothetical protein
MKSSCGVNFLICPREPGHFPASAIKHISPGKMGGEHPDAVGAQAAQ